MCAAAWAPGMLSLCGVFTTCSDRPEYEIAWNQEGRIYSDGWDIFWGTPLEPGDLGRGQPAFAVMRVHGVPWTPGDMEPLVFLDESGARVAVPREFTPNGLPNYGYEGDCLVDVMSYDLRGLPNGTYQVVHRYASMEGYTGRLRDVRWPQGEYEGEFAVIGTFTLRRYGPFPDAGP